MTDGSNTLAENLKQAALCRTGHPADAASMLMLAAGELLHSRFGIADAIDLLRTIIDDTERAMVDRHGRQPGEAVQ